MTARWIAAAVALTMLAGCNVGVRHRPLAPGITPPPVFRGSAGAEATSLADLKWFEVFEDQHLQELIRTALVRNYDLRAAVARIDSARANLGLTRADRLPSFGAEADVTTLRFSRGGNFPVPEG